MTDTSRPPRVGLRPERISSTEGSAKDWIVLDIQIGGNPRDRHNGESVGRRKHRRDALVERATASQARRAKP